MIVIIRTTGASFAVISIMVNVQNFAAIISGHNVTQRFARHNQRSRKCTYFSVFLFKKSGHLFCQRNIQIRERISGLTLCPYNNVNEASIVSPHIAHNISKQEAVHTRKKSPLLLTLRFVAVYTSHVCVYIFLVEVVL